MILDNELLLIKLMDEKYKDNESITEQTMEMLEENEKRVYTDSVNMKSSDKDMEKECRLKIIKVTNVYKVAYLKTFIHKKRLKRANKRALFNKKVCTHPNSTGIYLFTKVVKKTLAKLSVSSLIAFLTLFY